MFWRFDILIILKICFSRCFYHVPYNFVIGFLHVFVHVSFMFLSCFSQVPFLALYNKFLQFFLLCFQYSDLFVTSQASWDMVHMVLIKNLPCFRGFKTCLFDFFHILGACFRLLFESIQQNCWCNQVVICYPMFLDGQR